jgi:hemin uptake protein HemP
MHPIQVPHQPPANGAQALPLQRHNLAPAANATLRTNSRALLGDGRELEIEHAGCLYRLRLTSLGKLILTK